MIVLKCSVCGEESKPGDYMFAPALTRYGPVSVLVVMETATIHPVLVAGNQERKQKCDAVCNRDFCKQEISRLTGVASDSVYEFEKGEATAIPQSDRSKDN